LLCLISQDRMWCISLVPNAWNLSGGCQTTQNTQEAGDLRDATQDVQDTGDADST